MVEEKEITLLTIPSIRKDESFESWLEYLAHENWYKSAYVIKKLFREQMNYKDELHAPQRAKTYRIISQITRKPAKEIYRTTINTYAPYFQPLGDDIKTIKISSWGEKYEVPLISKAQRKRHCWSKEDVRYCPHCLSEGKYHRKQWYLKAVTMCIYHKCLLIRGCPCCERKGLQIYDLVKGECRKCGADLTKRQTLRLVDNYESFFAQRNIQYWLNIEPKPLDSGNYLFRLSQLAKPPVRYQLLMGIVQSLKDRRVLENGGSWVRNLDSYYKRYFDGEVDTKNLDPISNHIIMMTAFLRLTNWPRDFKHLLYWCRKGAPDKEQTTLKEDFGSLYNKLEDEWLHPSFAFVQQVFNDYLLANYTLVPSINHTKRLKRYPELALLFPFVNITEAADMLSTTPTTIKRLIKIKKLSTEENIIQRKSRQYRYVSRRDVLELQKVWDISMTLDEVVELVGITKSIANDLREIGILEAVRGPEIDNYNTWMIKRASVETLLIRLKEVMKHASNAREFSDVTLTYATQHLSRYEYNAAKLIKLILEKKVRGYWGWDKEKDLKNIRINLMDIRDILDVEQEEFPFTSRSQLAKQMGVKLGVVVRWGKYGLLGDKRVVGLNTYFAKAETEAFMANHIFSDEAAELLDVGQLVVQKWCRKGRLKPISGPGIDDGHRYLFRRADVEKLLPENRLTAPQLAELIGISRNRMVEWIKEGKIKPFSGPTVDSCKHYLFLKSEVTEFLVSNPD